jgi:hypothetical protein
MTLSAFARRLISRPLGWASVVFAALVLTFAAIVICIGRVLRSPDSSQPRLCFGSVPILNNKYWAKAMKKAGFTAETFTTDFYSKINRREDWDRLLSEEYHWAPASVRPYLGFMHVLASYDVVFISFHGMFIGHTPLWRLQAPLLQLAGLKIIAIPYGSDSYVYRDVRSTSLIHGLLASYPAAARQQDRVSAAVRYWCRKADVVIPGVMGPDGFGRWDVLLPSQLFIDTEEWRQSSRKTAADGIGSEVVVVHAPNHRGFKGSEFVVWSIERLREEGLKVRLVLLEGIQNHEVMNVLREQADVLVEQLVFTGHGLNGLEGMASGLTVISNLEDEQYIAPLRRWSYFSECPIVSASPENLTDVLRKLICRPDLRHKLGEAGRAYVEKYHGLESAAYLFREVIEFAHGRRPSLMNLYHPLLGAHPRRLPRVVHPLINNKIPD